MPFSNDIGQVKFLVFQVVNIEGNPNEFDDLWPVIKVFAKDYNSIPTIEELQNDNPLPAFYTPEVYSKSHGINDKGQCWIRYTYTIIDRSISKYKNVQEIGSCPLFFPISIDEKGQSYYVFIKDLSRCVTIMRKSWNKAQIEKALSVLSIHHC